MVERIGSFIEEGETFGLRVPGCRAAEMQVELTEEQKTWDQSAPCTSQKVKTEHLVARTFFLSLVTVAHLIAHLTFSLAQA